MKKTDQSPSDASFRELRQRISEDIRSGTKLLMIAHGAALFVVFQSDALAKWPYISYIVTALCWGFVAAVISFMSCNVLFIQLYRDEPDEESMKISAIAAIVAGGTSVLTLIGAALFLASSKAMGISPF